ncbi:MAG: glycosyltransferase [Clostridia bacterium]|nr:glycosyltransferase [Clostridia bacterium]
MEPLVSIVMATFNEPPIIIGRAIESVLAQTYKNIELIIIDDSTNADTLNKIKEYLNDNRVKYVHPENKAGFVPALNIGLSLSKGKYIARMDGDDICFLDRLEKQIKFLKENPEVMLAGGQIEIIDFDGKVISKRHYPTSGAGLFFFSCLRSPFAHSTVIMRRELIDAGFKYDESLPASEDIDLWLRIMYAGHKVRNIGDTVLQFRVADDFAQKRSADKEVIYTALARKKNFSFKHIFHWILSYLCSRIYLYMPSKWLAFMHKKQNHQN